MTCHVRMSLHLLLLSNYLLLQVHTIEPIPLWKAIEKAISLEKVDKRECTRIILYNTAAERYVLDGNITESKYIFVKIDFDSSFASTDILDQVQRTTNDTIKKAIDKRSMHCFLAISMVNTSQEVVDMESQRMSPTEMQEKKLGYSLELIKLLQFKSPVNQRSLILVRYGNSSTDFGQCRKSIYQRYPVRLVPLWEQALFDFFPSALAIHAVSKLVVPTHYCSLTCLE